MSGPTPPIVPPPMKSPSRTMPCARRSTAKSRRANQCPGIPPGPMAGNPKYAPRSSTSSPSRRGRWAIHPHHRPRPSDNQDRLGQPCLQHETHALARCSDRADLTTTTEGKINKAGSTYSVDQRVHRPGPTYTRFPTENTVIGGLQLLVWHILPQCNCVIRCPLG